jgi:hypothetical protein
VHPYPIFPPCGLFILTPFCSFINHRDALQHISSRTALLHAPERIISRDYTDSVAPQLEQYINKHCHDWYHFANTNIEYEAHGSRIRPHKRELHLAPDALILVTGVDLTSGWRTMISSGENAFHRGHHEFIDHHGFVYECIGDEDRRMARASALREPQAIFIRGYKFCDFRAEGGAVSRLAHAVSDFIHHDLPVTGRKVCFFFFCVCDDILINDLHRFSILWIQSYSTSTRLVYTLTPRSRISMANLMCAI